MLSFIFVRHGKSQANLDGMIADANSPLATEGELQVRATAAAIKSSGITRIICSPMLRARQTADIIAHELGLDPNKLTELDTLRERSFGELENTPKTHPTSWYYTVDSEYGIEPRDSLIARCNQALATIRKLAQTENILVVGHGVAGFYLQQLAAGRERFENFAEASQMDNAAGAKIVIH